MPLAIEITRECAACEGQGTGGWSMENHEDPGCPECDGAGRVNVPAARVHWADLADGTTAIFGIEFPDGTAGPLRVDIQEVT